MKKALCVLLTLPLFFCLAACGCAAQNTGGKGMQASQVSDENFALTVCTQKTVYNSDEPVKIWATLTYTGPDKQATVWHDEPFVGFRISDGNWFDSENVFECVLSSTVMERGKVYTYEYVKSGGYDANAPHADFWKKFYDQKELILPKGTYTVTAVGSFSLTQGGTSGLLPQLTIRVK